MREVARQNSGMLYEAALQGVASKLGERLGPDCNIACPRMTAYLTSVIMSKRQKIATPVLRECRTLAEAIDELSTGHVAATADLAMPTFKAIEHGLGHGGTWNVARALEVTRDEDGLVSIEEELTAAKRVLKRAKLAEAEKKAAVVRGSHNAGS